jgi:predicted GNAT family N-acyltransferase
MSELTLHTLVQLAVLQEHQRQGHGAAIMQALQQYCDEHKPQLLPKMHAQAHAMPFYESQGWKRCGEEFVEAGIPHVTMIRPPADPSQLLANSDDRTPDYIRTCLRACAA